MGLIRDAGMGLVRCAGMGLVRCAGMGLVRCAGMKLTGFWVDTGSVHANDLQPGQWPEPAFRPIPDCS